MNVLEYTRIVEETDHLEPKSPSDPNYKIMPILGLAGEIGSLLTELKKRVRDPHRIESLSRSRIEEEIGDIIWYAATLARRAGLDFQQDVLLKNLQRIAKNPSLYLERKSGDSGEGTATSEALDTTSVESFSSYQKLAGRSSRFKEHLALVPYLAQIWKNSGELFGSVDFSNAQFLEGEPSSVSEALGDVMWYVAGFATIFELDLDQAAKNNTAKALSMFPPERSRNPTPLYDDDQRLEYERFPRVFDVDFVSIDNDTSIMLINGLQVGDPLKDNAYQLDVGPDGLIDGYRFHDSIHLAFVAVLGWSPVLRGLMKRKRKTNKAIDDAEDGARAQIVEEMIVKLAHSYAISADRIKLLTDQKHISMDLLKQIAQLAEGLEVSGSHGRKRPCKLWEWEKAILLGFDLFNKLRQHKAGRVRVDLKQRTVSFSVLDPSLLGRFPAPT